MTILGIDPGIATTGYGIIEKQGQKLSLIDYDCISTKAQNPTGQRLNIIYKQLEKIIKRHKPSIIAVEELFFCKNAKSALQVGQARGVVLLTAELCKLPLYEFTPLEVKQAITGYGRADKQQIQKMVRVLLSLKKIPKPDDAADALAVAICCAHSI